MNIKWEYAPATETCFVLQTHIFKLDGLKKKFGPRVSSKPRNTNTAAADGWEDGAD